MNIFQRLIYAIPFLRHKCVRKEIASEKEELNLIDLCNRLISCIHAKNIVSLYNEGRFDLEAIETPDAYRFFVEKMIGKQSRSIMSKLKVERATIKTSKCKVIIVHLPSTHEIGQAAMIGFVITESNKAFGYSLEYSINKLLMICSWEDDKHFNYGTADDKVDFVRKIVQLSSQEDLGETSKPLEEKISDRDKLLREKDERIEESKERIEELKKK